MMKDLVESVRCWIKDGSIIDQLHGIFISNSFVDFTLFLEIQGARENFQIDASHMVLLTNKK